MEIKPSAKLPSHEGKNPHDHVNLSYKDIKILKFKYLLQLPNYMFISQIERIKDTLNALFWQK